MKFSLSALLTVWVFFVSAQNENPANDPVAAALLQKVSEKYKAYKNISASFRLIIQNPKLKPEEDERKYADTLKGQIILEGAKFNVAIGDQQIFCDGKTVWSYTPSEKEVQENDYEESDDIFSPSKIFSLYQQGYLYQLKEKKAVEEKKITVIEVAPPNKKVTYFKIDISIDEDALQIFESKVYQKNGVRYIYRLLKQSPNVPTSADTFTFNPKKHPEVKVVNLK